MGSLYAILRKWFICLHDNADTDSAKNDDDSNHNESDVNDDKALKT